MKKLIALFLTLIMLLTMMPMSALAAEANSARLVADSVDTSAGERFNVDIMLENNPGIVSANISIAFDDGLTLVGAKNGSTFPSHMSYIPPRQLSTVGKIIGICNFAWAGTDISDNEIKDGVILTLTFEASADAQVGDSFNITVSSSSKDIVDRDLNEVDLPTAKSVVTITDYTPGDVNEDGAVSMMDTVMISRYIVDGQTTDPNGYNIEINENAADVNDDDSISMMDVVMVSRYIVDGCKTDPNGYNIELKHKTKKCAHSLTYYSANEATCEEDGNKEYWYCALCDKYFVDYLAKTLISQSDTVIKATGHQIITIPGYPAEPGKEGLTDGEKCSVCGKVTKEQDVIPALEVKEYSIKYYPYNNDGYLQNVGVENSNPQKFSCNSTLKLKNLKVDGYVFDGWYDAEGKSGQLVREIPAGSVGDGETIELYAKWSLKEYEVIFDSPDVPVESITFTVNKRVPLKNIELQGYTFMGWSVKDTVINPVDGSVFSDDGKVITEIPIGTADDVVVHANWTSNRNLTRPVSKLGDPLFVEDMDNNQLLFTYKIGTIENVPLYTIANLPNSAGLTWEIESDVTKSVDAKTAQTISNTVANATHTTASVTLESDWNQVSTATEETGSENAKTHGQIDETGTVTGQQWYVSNSKGGAFSTTTSSGGSNSTSSKITDNASWGLENSDKSQISSSKTDTHSTELSASLTESQKDTFNWKLNGSIGGGKEASVGGNVGADVEGVGSAGVSAGAKKNSNWNIGGEVGGSTEKSYSATVSGSIVDTKSATVAAAREKGVTATLNGSVGSETNTVNESHYDTSATSSSNWNTTEGYEKSETVSKNQTVSDSISELIYNKYGISSSSSTGGSDSKTESTGRTDEVQNQYASTVEYSTSEITTQKQTLTNQGSGYGYYRVVQAATAHVFAVVGFDIATQSFYTSTYTVVDNDSAKVFVDHSRKSSSFNDCENGVLPFEIPFDLYKFTSRVMMRSSGLKINYETGIVERYEGSGSNVVIPEYAVDYNSSTKKYTVTKVTGIAPDAFRGKNLTGIILPDYITEIPDNAFENCLNLESFVSYGVTKIGANAFKNCTSLKHYSVDRFVTQLGNNAFENVDSIDIEAANSDVVDAALASGAKSITLDLSKVEDTLDNKIISVGEIDHFALLSDGKEYRNLQIKSDAKETVIGNMVLKENIDTPINISSEKVDLNSVTVSGAPGFAMILTGHEINLTLDGVNSMNSNSSSVILSRSVVITEQNDGSVGKLNVKGNVLICGNEVIGKEFLNVSDGEIKYNITEEEFNAYLTSSKVTFDANGGSVSDGSKTVYYGQTYGAMPIPTKANYGFDGWYTEPSGGTRITESTLVTALVNQTLYAHWIANKFNLTYNANGGTVASDSKELNFGDSLGELPTPTRDYYNFLGWFTTPEETETEKGEQVFETTTPMQAKDLTIYARWTQNNISGWVLASDVPEDAEIVNRKYSYTQRSYSQSGSSSMEGWVKYDTKRTSWGGTQGPVYSDPSNGSRNVWSESYISGYGSTYYWHFYKYGYSALDYSYSGPSGGRTYFDVKLDYYPSNSSQRPVSKDGSTFKWYAEGTSKWAAVYYASEGNETDYNKPIYATRWYYQDPVYTYYYYKDEAKEAANNPTGDNISNIIEWVQYRSRTNSEIEPSGAVYNGHVYKLITCQDPLSWSVAKAYCEHAGGYLATITSAEEQNVVSGLGTVHAWLGGYRTSNDNFAWITGEAFNYSNWIDGEPNNGGGTENCIGIYPDHGWNDYSETTTSVSSFVLEYELPKT